MTEFYIKNKQGKYLPINLKSIFGKDLNGKLVIIRVGSDDHIASSSDLDETEESFNRADILNELENVSIIITSYQIDINACPKEDLENKNIYVQITSGNDAGMLDEQARKIYNKIKRKNEAVIMPVPLKIGEYKKIIEILKRCEIRRDRRSRKNKI